MRKYILLGAALAICVAGMVVPVTAQCYWANKGSGSGTLLWTGDYDWWTGLYLYSGVTYKFELVIPCSADFDIYIYRITYDWWGNRNPSSQWPLLCSGQAGTCITENPVCTPSVSGNYAIKVVSYRGSGSYTLKVYYRSCS